MKKWDGGWVSNRSGSQFELLTELKMVLALSCTFLHIRCTCSQQISQVIALNIAEVAQKVQYR